MKPPMAVIFPSPRNRVFAFAAAVYLALIYGTLGIMPEFFNWLLRLTGRAGFSLTITGFMIAVTALILLLARRAIFPLDGMRALGLAAIGAGYGLLIYWADFPTSRVHALLYGVLALLVTESLRGALAFPRLHLYTLLLVMAAAVVDESIQALLPNRTGALVEVLQNWGSAALAQCAVILLKDSRAPPPGLAANSC